MVWSSAFHIRDALLQGNLMRSTLKRVEFQPLRGFPCLKLEPLWHDINLVDRPPFSRFFFKCNIHAYFLRHGDTSRQNWKNANIMMSSKDWWVQKLGESPNCSSNSYMANGQYPKRKTQFFGTLVETSQSMKGFQLVFPPKALQLTLRSLWNTVSCILS